ncbi:unnamed protein product [Trifolium pratense]|uniref:Uncharacterized protein n=1 Tax=Trifolium pratense TaxID=57577 RepID=A0ACB0L370_TRIPR|nr:unnamed protein product [Trifolium pratense]
MLNNSDQYCMQIITTITYSIWFARNNKVFQHNDTPVIVALERALKILHEYQRNIHENRLTTTGPESSIVSNNKSWSPPPKDYLKLNVDAHLSGDGHWGLGLVLRREDGHCIGAATKMIQGTEDVCMAEVMGCCEALEFIWKLHLPQVVIEMDSATVVRAIQKQDFPRSHWGQAARRCARALSQDSQSRLSVRWIARDGNRAAHALARWALIEPNKLWTNEFPTCLIHHIQKDMEFVP